MSTDDRPVAILVSEADRVIRMVTVDMLAEEGFQCIEVSTADEALAVLNENATVRMLITGRRIKGDGIALAHRVHNCWPHVSIIVTSGAGLDVEAELPPGARLLRKPYSFVDLVHEVQNGLSPGQTEPALAAPVLPIGVPPHTGTDMGIGMAAAPAGEPDKT